MSILPGQSDSAGTNQERFLVLWLKMATFFDILSKKKQ